MLRTLGGVLLKHIRASDIPCRYGGEEFCLILPGAEIAIATARAEAIRSFVTTLTLMHEETSLGAITLSLGVASLQAEDSSPLAIVHRADKALYSAKQAGRNRVVVDGQPETIGAAPVP